MNNTRKIVIIVACAAGVILVALAVFFALTTTVKADYAGRISRGNQYLEAGDYNKAVSEFKAALEMDETKPDAYEGLSDAYDGLGYAALSQEILEQGVQATGDSDLQLMLVRKFPERTLAGGTEESVKETENREPALNNKLLSLIAGATFADYDHEYDVELVSSEEETFVYDVKELGIALVYDNNGNENKINQDTRMPYREFMPDEVRIKDLSYLFGYSGAMAVTQLKGMDGIQGLITEDGVVTFNAKDCLVRLFVNEEGMIQEGAENVIVSLKASGELPEETVEAKILSGTITDAATGKAVSGAAVRVYSGNSETGTPQEATSAEDGSYSVETAAGDNYIVVEKEGYIRGTFEVYVLSNSGETGADFAISKELGEGEIRIVLTWGDSPRDLDSYLRGTTGSGQSFETSYGNKTAKDSGGNTIAELDLDDVDGNGPETTTLYDLSGSYEFYVKDFHETGTMAGSGAQVKVYKGNSLVQTIDITPDAGNIWHVLKIENGEISVTNTP